MATKQVHTMTEDEHIKLVEVGDSFWTALSKLAAEHIQMMPPQLRDVTVAYLQDKCSIYSTDYDSLLSEAYRGPTIAELIAQHTKG